MSQLTDQQILESWHDNAQPWTRAVRAQQIASRVEVTDQAIVDVVLNLQPSTVLDVGCGEGWLARRLTAAKIDVLGIDAVSALIEQANVSGGARFKQLAYERLGYDALQQTYDLMVCNFSLLGEDSVNAVFEASKTLLKPHGALVIQTLHPIVSCGELPYQEGWREGSWQGFSDEFTNPAPWYFRTFDAWLRLCVEHRLSVSRLIEPVSATTSQPVSLIIVAHPVC